MANDGYIKLYRKMTDWGWYKDQNTKDVFLHLLLEACYEPCFFRNANLKAGQIATTVKEIKEKTGISEQSIRTSLNRLKSTNEITIETTNKFSIITLNNYADYQGANNQSNNQLTNNQQTTNKQLTNATYNKEIKKLRNEEIKNISSGKTKFVPPTLQEVKDYCSERKNNVDAERFFDYYSANGWVQGKGKPIKDWKACIRTWERGNGFATTTKKPKESISEHWEKVESRAMPTAAEIEFFKKKAEAKK